MSASHDQGPETLDFGTMGSLTSLPAGFSVSHVLVASRGGVNKAFRAWGDHLLSYYGKPPQWSKNGGDVTSSYLGYTTDNVRDPFARLPLSFAARLTRNSKLPAYRRELTTITIQCPVRTC